MMRTLFLYGAVTAGELFAVGYVDPPKETTRRIPRKPYVADENAEKIYGSGRYGRKP